VLKKESLKLKAQRKGRKGKELKAESPRLNGQGEGRAKRAVKV
jgi:hypothetical protein